MVSKLKVILGVVLIMSVWPHTFVAAEPLKEYIEARNMYLFAAACRASYDDTIGHMAIEALESNGWNAQKYFTSGKNANTRFLLFVKTQPENGEPMYLIAVTGTETAQDLLADLSFNKIIFRGHSIQELKDNARSKVFSKKVPLVHWGFFQYALSAWEMDYHDEKSNGEKKLIRELVENPTCKIYLIGHSLGGAVVTLGAAGLISSGIDPSRIEVVSFGAPAVGNDAFRREFESKINLTRVVMHGDPIARVLQDAVGGYEQFGKQINWHTTQKTFGEAHEMTLYLDVAMKNYYKKRQEAVTAGAISFFRQSLPQDKEGKLAYIVPLKNNLPSELRDEFAFMQEAITDTYQDKVPCYYLAEKGLGGVGDLKAAAALNCQLVIAPSVYAYKQKHKTDEYTIVLEQTIYETASGAVTGMEIFTSTTRNMTPLESFVHNTVNLGQDSTKWLAK